MAAMARFTVQTLLSWHGTSLALCSQSWQAGRLARPSSNHDTILDLRCLPYLPHAVHAGQPTVPRSLVQCLSPRRGVDGSMVVDRVESRERNASPGSSALGPLRRTIVSRLLRHVGLFRTSDAPSSVCPATRESVWSLGLLVPAVHHLALFLNTRPDRPASRGQGSRYGSGLVSRSHR